MEQDVKKKVDKFFGNYRLYDFKKGKIIIFGGEKPDSVYYLLEGTVKQYIVSSRGDEVVINVFKPPSFFPISQAISNLPDQYIYEGDTDIKVRVAPSTDVLGFLKNNPEVMFDLIDRLYRGLNGVVGRMTHLMSSSAKNRLIYELIIQCERFGERLDGQGYRIKMSEKQLGSRAGLSRETVNREINKLKKEGELNIDHGTITIKDISELRKNLELAN